MNNTSKTRDTVFIALFAVFIAVCSWISIPTAIPFTMQIFGVFLALNYLGGKKGILCVVVYLLMGIVGLPVYANGTAGIGILMGMTGGYMIGWLFSGLVMWFFEALIGKKIWAQFLSMLVGLLVCYAIGTAWFMVVYAQTAEAVGLWAALCWCVFPFIIPDLAKLGLVLWLTQRLDKIVKTGALEK